MSKELRMYVAYAGFINRVLPLIGMCPSGKKRNIFHRWISVWSVLSPILSVCTVGNFCMKNVGNVALLTTSLSIVTTVFNVQVKAIRFFIHQKKLERVNEALDSLLEETSTAEGEPNSVIFFNLRSFYRLIYAETVFTVFALVIFGASPGIGMAFHGAKNASEPLYLLPLPAVYPWSIDSKLAWQLHYIYEVNCLWVVFVVSTSVDGFFGFCVFRMSMLLRWLALEFETSFTDDKENGTHQRKLFERYVGVHAEVLKCRDIVREVYDPVVLLIAVTNALAMCALMYQAVQVGGVSAEKIGKLTFYFLLKLIQTYLYVWPGDVMSELLRRNVYFSSWYERNSRAAKYFLLVLMQRPVRLKAYNFLDVSMDLFAKVLNTTISYYFLLETMDSKK